ncbi:MAG: DUF5618 family protein [Cytophagales bacterium]
MAGNTLWNGVLEALDYRFPEILSEICKTNIAKYKEAVAKENKKMLSKLISAYDTLHLAMDYDGSQRYSLAQEGIKEAKKYIDWAANEGK